MGKLNHELFTEQANLYAQFRPTYPVEMLQWISECCREHKVLWDCATGSGQVAIAMVEKFDKIFATDLNAAQLANAPSHPRIEYLQLPAEKTEFTENSVDLVTVAQVLHWFDHGKFNMEVTRVLKPGGIYTQYPSIPMVLSCAKFFRFKFYSVGRYLHSSFIKFKSEELCFAQRINKLIRYIKLGKNVRHRDSSRMGRSSANHSGFSECFIFSYAENIKA